MAGRNETVRTQLGKPLPALSTIPGARIISQSVSKETLATRLMFPWHDFALNVSKFIEDSNLNKRVPILDTSPEFVVVRDETNLSGRFFQHIGQVVGKAWNASRVENLRRYRFHDAYINENLSEDGLSIPDVLVSQINSTNTIPKFAGELKTFWTVPLEPVSIIRRNLLNRLRPHLGQLVKYMRTLNLKFGFLCTYEYTIFVKREDQYRFELSEPIHYSSQQPSIRQCFYYLGHLAESSGSYFQERPDFEPKLLSVPEGSTSNSPRPNQYKTYNNNNGSNGKNTTDESGRSESSTAKEMAKNTATKLSNNVISLESIKINSIFYGDGIWNSTSVIVKYWPEPRDDTEARFGYNNEVGIYNKLPRSDFIPVILDHGSVMLASDIKGGNLVILKKEQGTTFSHKIWAAFSETEKHQFRKKLVEAHAFLRAHNLLQGDPRKDNVLVREGRIDVILLDMEGMIVNEEEDPADGQEVYEILDMDIDI